MTRRAFALAALVGLLAPSPGSAQTYTYAGPFAGFGATAPLWSMSNWIGGTPTSSSTTRLIFPNFDTAAATNTYVPTNDLGNPFVLNAVDVFNRL